MRKALLLAALFVCTTLTVMAQRMVTGKILDANGMPLSGVTIKAQKSGKVALTGADGSFSLAANEDDMLEITSIGYQKQTVSAKSATVAMKMATAVETMGEVVMVGTRRAGRVKTETPVPVDVINVSQAMTSTGRMDLTATLNYLAPSFNFNKQTGSDGADHIDLATLRGLGPDQTLVLVNGKRRHQTAFVAVFGTRGRGNSGTDLNAIPIFAIDRVEILRDGASAQYGSDAIAGVINIITKKSVNQITGSIGGSGYYDPAFNPVFDETGLKAEYEYFRGGSGTPIRSRGTKRVDGRAYLANVNFGVPMGNKGGYLNLTFEGNMTGRTYRQDLSGTLPVNIYRRGHGDAELNSFSTFYNFELPTKGKMTLYSFGSQSSRRTDAYAFTRNFSARPDRFPTDNNGNLIFVSGIMRSSGGDVWYNPRIQTHINDVSATAGARGVAFGSWGWDLSNTTGRNNFHFFGKNTFNASQGDAQRNFDDGGFAYLQNTTNLNFSRNFAKNLSLGLGAEYRYENYQIMAGEEASYRNYDDTKATGSQGFPGYQPADEVKAKRNVLGVYGDLEFDVNSKWMMDLAVRLENYSDFGFTHNYKFATRYEASKKVKLRGSVSTGFRAPSLQQMNFSSTFTTVQGGNIAEVKIAPNYSSLAAAAGIPELKQEKSLSGAAGLIWSPRSNLNITIDGYLTRINDRVVLSGQFDGSDPALSSTLRAQMAALNVSYAQFFANAVNTTNAGVDVIIDYTKKIGENRLKFVFAGNYQHMSIDKINVPKGLSGSEFLRQTFLSDREQAFILASAPNMKGALNLEYTRKTLTVGARATYFGEVSLYGYGQDGLGINPTVPLNNGSGDVPDQYIYAGKVVTDIYASMPFWKRYTVSLGVDNVLNVHPDLGAVKGAEDWAYNNETGGPFDAVQMGGNGRRLFLRIGFKF